MWLIFGAYCHWILKEVGCAYEPSATVTLSPVNIKHPLSAQHRLTTLALVVSKKLLWEE